MEINKSYLSEVWNDIVKGVKEIPNSVLFWNGLVFLMFIFTLFVNLEVFVSVQGLASILALAIVFDGDADKNQIWILGTAFFWIAITCRCNGVNRLDRDTNNRKIQRPLTRAEKKEIWKQQHIQKKKSKRLLEKQ
jgi:hypothetical protein